MAEEVKAPAPPAAGAGARDESRPGENDQPPRNPWLCVMISGGLLLIGVVALIFMGICSILGRPIPSELVMIAIGAMTSLPGFLTVVPRGSAGYSSAQSPPFIRR